MVRSNGTMQSGQRVVWYEGMTLDPHHFQQWDRHQQHVLSARGRMAGRYDRGFATLDIDQDRLANGEFVVRACSGLMPDGLAFNIPERDPAPAPRNVKDAFEATDEALPVSLAIPAEQPQGGNVLLQSAAHRRETRFAAKTVRVPDENTGADERRVEVAQANFQIRFGGEPLEEYVTLPVARVTRTASGPLALDASFIPPCLSIAASDALMATTRRLLERLVAKSDALRERQQNAAARRELSPGDVTTLGLLGAIDGAIPVLNHHYVAAKSPPEALYVAMLSLAGRLSACLPGAGIRPRALPGYDHDAPASCFYALDEVLRELLGEAEPAATYTPLDLRKQGRNGYVATPAPGVLQAGQLFLAVRAPGRSEEDLVGIVPRKTRVAAPGDIDAVIRSYTRALPVEHTHRLPAGMPVDDQASYFRLQKRGPFWTAIEEEAAIALFVPSGLDDLEIQLVAVEREGRPR